MTLAFFSRLRKWLAAFAIIIAVRPACAQAAWVADPAVLYQQMKDAYAKGTTDGWNFRAEETYLSTIFNAGRAYSLQYPNDPAYGELATLTVQVGTGLHYNPLTNHDGAVWWVREAADWVTKHAEDTTLIAQAEALLQRANSEDDPDALARFADEDATANLRNYPGDVDALVLQVEADWRGWLLTGDPQWRSLALARAAAPTFPVAHLPTNWGNELINAANTLSAGNSADARNAATLIDRIKAVDPIRVIASVTAVPHDVYLSTLAPADEYFGKMEMSVLEIENRLKHINFMLDYKYGNRESAETANVANSIDGMQKIYPRDRDLPMLLYWCYTTAERMDDVQAKTVAHHLRAILTIEYQDSPQARKLLSGST
jgi:hypothetical protein